MDFMERARLYGQAVGVVNDFLGENAREKVMARFRVLAPRLQQRAMRDPWEMIARSATAAGIRPPVVEALRIAYLARVDRLDEVTDWDRKSPEVLRHLRDWGLLDATERRLRGD